MFDVLAHAEIATCIDCQREKECLIVRCKAGLFSGPHCAKCLFKEARKRSRPKVPEGTPASGEERCCATSPPL